MRREEIVEVRGAALWTVEQGDGPPLVLCHGGPGMWDYLAPLADQIDDLATIYRYEQRACGRSTGGPPYDVAGAVADLEALRKHWGIDRWIVAGHSWGATLVLAYCLAHRDRVTGLLYISGTGIDPRWHQVYRAAWPEIVGADNATRVRALADQIGAAGSDESSSLYKEVLHISLSADFADRTTATDMARAFLEGAPPSNMVVNRQLGADGNRFAESQETQERLRHLRVPALLVHGAADPRPAFSAQALADLLPQVEMVVMNDVGHFPWLERPAAFRGIVAPFLHRVSHQVGST